MHTFSELQASETSVITKASVVFKAMNFMHPSYYWELGKFSQREQLMPHPSEKVTGIFSMGY